MSKQVRKIEIRVSTTGAKGLKSVSKEMAKLNKNVKGLDVGLGRLKNTFLAFAGAMGVRELARAADTFQLLNDRMKVFSKDSEEANKTFKSVAIVAKTAKTCSESGVGICSHRKAPAEGRLWILNTRFRRPALQSPGNRWPTSIPRCFSSEDLRRKLSTSSRAGRSTVRLTCMWVRRPPPSGRALL